MRILSSSRLIAGIVAFGATGALILGVPPVDAPARAQITVFDPSNYSQNILTAARTLQQINNQIQSLQNEAAMLLNQRRNLARIDFPQLQEITRTMQAIDQLMAQARGIELKVATLDQQYAGLFPKDFGEALKASQQVAAARARLDTSRDGFRHAMTVQAQVVENIDADARALADVVARSQGAEGGLAAQQATNQLIALTAKQQFQLQQMIAAQFRAEAIEAARRVQAEQEARGATRKFLGTGKAYTPQQ
jgi:P-type conjugative transfer protein TrbJ